MSMKLYVGNLAYSMGDQELQELFNSYGTIISSKVITDRDSGRSKGFGFVEFEDEGAGQEAIKQVNGQGVNGRALVVNEARPQEARPPRRDFGDNNNRSRY